MEPIGINPPESILDWVEDEILATAARAPKQLRLADFTATIISLIETASRFSESESSKRGKPVSCGKGCGACCRQLVTISPAEAFYLADLVAKMPPERAENIRARFAKTLEEIAAGRLTERLARLDDSALGEAEHYRIAEDYFRLQIPCPFLENESCSIHQHRPAVCREYTVASPASNCADPFVNSVDRIPVSAPFSDAQTALCAQVMKTEIEPIPIPFALQWADDRGELREQEFESANLFALLLLHLDLHSGSSANPI
ncbi:YkgJ family cysteine cluster protein [Candidatus Sumerlaeota bacterium]|nr:YkgJ family cysteine cluster protein [Candidatus Sumerlaeota bacterium]